MNHFRQRRKREEKIMEKEKPLYFIRISIAISTKTMVTHSQGWIQS